MKEKVKKILNKKYFITVLLSMIILLQLVNITNIIVNRKKSYHSDEIFSYALSNSFYKPFLETDSIYDDIDENNQHNINNWISADVIRNYVSVQKGEQFRYDSVWYNQSKDRHPPFYYTVMHTICSFFPDTFSFVFGYIINFVCFAVTQIFLYKFARNILKSKYLALIVCIFWGFSSGAIDLTIFIRMYCMLAMWTVIFLYFHSKLLVTDSKPLLRQLIPIIAVTLFGTLTHYLFLFVAFITAVCFCIRYLCKKQFKIFFAYGFSILGATAAAMLIFPQYIPNMLSETDHKKTEFLRQLRLCARYLLDAIFPVTKSSLVFWIPTISSILIAIIIMSLPILYLFRDKMLVIRFIGKLKSSLKSMKYFSLKKTLLNIAGRLKKINFMTIIMLICIAAIMALTAYSIVFNEMFYIDRYLFILYPIAALFIACLIYFLFSWFKYKKQLLAAILIFVTIVKLPSLGLHYLFDYNHDIENIEEITTDAECIFVSAELSEIWMIDYLAAEMYNADKLFVTYTAKQEDSKKELESINTDKPIYLFLQTPESINIDEEEYYWVEKYDKKNNVLNGYTVSKEEYSEKYINFYKNLSISKKFEYMGTHVMFTREYSVYRLA